MRAAQASGAAQHPTQELDIGKPIDRRSGPRKQMHQDRQRREGEQAEEDGRLEEDKH